jgi:hypothetical protein
MTTEEKIPQYFIQENIEFTANNNNNNNLVGAVWLNTSIPPIGEKTICTANVIKTPLQTVMPPLSQTIISSSGLYTTNGNINKEEETAIAMRNIDTTNRCSVYLKRLFLLINLMVLIFILIYVFTAITKSTENIIIRERFDLQISVFSFVMLLFDSLYIMGLHKP